MKINFPIICSLFLVIMLSCETSQKFDSQKWRLEGDQIAQFETRKSMANDIVKSDILLNKTDAEIEKLLGDSLHTNSKSAGKFPSERRYWVYETIEGNLGFIVVQYSESRRAKSVRYSQE